jgi:hypothetical protein
MMILTMILWEFLQNMTLMLPSVSAVWFWKHREIPRSTAKSVTSIAVGGIVGPVSMHYTEPLIAGGPKPSLQELSYSIVVISVLVVIFTLYLSKWGNWKTDTLAGVTAGVALAIVQYWISGNFSWVVHAIAMAIACSVCLIGFRLAIPRSKDLKTALLHATPIILIVSVAVVLIDYV